jgi:hypothetical protein
LRFALLKIIRSLFIVIGYFHFFLFHFGFFNCPI